MKQNKKLPKIIYIMGTARSGTTILEILLANGYSAFGASELTNIVNDGFIKNKKCSCNHLTSDCAIWGAVKGKLVRDFSDIQTYGELQKRIEWHSGFLRQLFGQVSKEDEGNYKAFNIKLLSSIRDVTGCDIVIDSSKFAGRALALKNILKLNVSVICLTRSPSGLMKSFQKPNKLEQRPKSTFDTLLYYILTTILLRLACTVLRKDVLQMRYEDLIENPVGVLERIEEWGEIDLGVSKNSIKNNKAFSVGHIVTGNLLRKEGKVTFKLNNDNEKTEGLLRQFTVALMNAWRFIIRF